MWHFIEFHSIPLKIQPYLNLQYKWLKTSIGIELHFFCELWLKKWKKFNFKRNKKLNDKGGFFNDFFFFFLLFDGQFVTAQVHLNPFDSPSLVILVLCGCPVIENETQMKPLSNELFSATYQRFFFIYLFATLDFLSVKF